MNVPGILALLLVLLACGALLACVYIVLMGEALLHPPRMTDARAMALLGRTSPSDLGLHFEETRFDVTDAASGKPLSLAGWWIPAEVETGTCVVLVHGFADAKVGALAWSGVFREAGVNQLLLDLRAHGQSGGRHTTGGWFEGEDLRQVIEQLPAQFPAKSSKIVLFGASLGAAASVRAALIGTKVHGVITDSLFASYDRATFAHANLLGLPRGMIRKLAIAYASARSRARFTGPAEPVEMLARLGVPVLQIQCGMDPFTPPEEASRLADAPMHPHSTCFRVPGATHLQALSVDPTGYRNAVAGFLAEVLGREPARSEPGTKD